MGVLGTRKADEAARYKYALEKKSYGKIFNKIRLLLTQYDAKLMHKRIVNDFKIDPEFLKDAAPDIYEQVKQFCGPSGNEKIAPEVSAGAESLYSEEDMKEPTENNTAEVSEMPKKRGRAKKSE